MPSTEKRTAEEGYSVDEIKAIMREAASLRLSEVTIEGRDTKICIKTGASIEENAMPVRPQESASSAKETEVMDAYGKLITSPMVGTFYAASGPDAPPFVKVGDSVKKGQTLCIIEAMKLMNEIESDYTGIVKKILVSNEATVEYGQPLFEIEVIV